MSLFSSKTGAGPFETLANALVMFVPRKVFADPRQATGLGEGLDLQSAQAWHSSQKEHLFGTRCDAER